MEPTINCGDGFVPMLWVHDGPSSLDEYLEADETIEEYELLGEFGESALYQTEWTKQVRFTLRIILGTDATVLSARGAAGTWKLKVMYADRSSLSEAHEFAQDHDISFEVRAIRDLQDEPQGLYGLTADQRKTLTAAAEAGYFEIPREVSLEELADTFDVSHQALSERLRRALQALVDETVFVSEQGEEDSDTRQAPQQSALAE